MSDPESAQLLTAREPTSYGRGEARPAQYLDYFHGSLHLSPDGRRLLDDGWVWHPVGIPVVWDLHAWLDENIWESEDGQRLFSSAQDGLSVWDLATGERTAYGPGFRPRRFCPGSGEFVEIRDGDVSVWSSR